MKNYLSLLEKVFEEGEELTGRNGKTRCLFGEVLEFTNISEEFPIITTRKINFKAVTAELLGFIRGADNAKTFRELGTNIWDANANSNQQWLASPYRKGQDDLGRIYGVQWRKWRNVLDGQVIEIDQLKNLVEKIISGNDERRAMLSCWNPGELPAMALAPCHVLCQVNVSGDDRFLDMSMYQRSADLPLGVPFNISSYALLLSMLGQISNRKPRRLLITLGNVHIYENQLPFVSEQLSREPQKLPNLCINPRIRSLNDLEQAITDDFYLVNYNSHSKINYPFSV